MPTSFLGVSHGSGHWQISKPLQLPWGNFNSSNELCVVRIFNLRGVSSPPRLGSSCLGLEGFQPPQGSFNPSSSRQLDFGGSSCLGLESLESFHPPCVFYYCRTYYKAVRVGGGGEWRTGAMRDDEPRPVWMSAHHALVNAGGREIV
jgi:hypothetical protein